MAVCTDNTGGLHSHYLFYSLRYLEYTTNFIKALVAALDGVLRWLRYSTGQGAPLLSRNACRAFLSDVAAAAFEGVLPCGTQEKPLS